MSHLLDLYAKMKKVLSEIGGYEKLSDEQKDLFNIAADKLLEAKFAEGTESFESKAMETKLSVEDFLLSIEPQPIINVSSLIQTADILDKIGQEKLANELDIILLKIAKLY